MTDKIVKVNFPLSVLKKSRDLLDPNNLETIWEYYLLENLACGLVRDSQSSPTGFSGCIAKSFYRKDKFSWSFQLSENYWSNGEKITDREIIDWLNRLKTQKSRHIKILNSLNSININQNTNELVLTFGIEVDESVLHELSLAESGLFPESYKDIGWEKTSGPYSVESWDPVTGRLSLIANKYSIFYQEKMLKKILVESIDVVDREKIFRSIDMGLVHLGPQTNPELAEKMLNNAPGIWVSQPMMILFFHFNSQNKEAHIKENREIFANLIEEAKTNLNQLDQLKDFRLEPEDQLIPEGFNGRLKDFKVLKKHLPPSMTKKIVLKMHSGYKDSIKLVDFLKKIFSNSGYDLEIKFRSGSSPIFEKEDFAGLYSFAGNQKDSSGSWAFLTSAPNGLLHDWVKIANISMKEIFLVFDHEKKEENLIKLHKEILENYLAIPFLIGSQRYLINNDIDISRWNRFDSRLRLYELQWK